MRNVLLRWVLVALGLGVLAGCVAVPGHTALNRPAQAVTSTGLGGATAKVAARLPARHRIMIMGASYTQGLGASPQTDGYAYLIGPDLRWESQVHGISGTGYLNPGPRHQGTFAQQLQRMPAGFDPTVLLVQGGRNDGTYPPDRLDAAIAATIRQAHQKFHRAKVVMLGPIPSRVPVDAGELRAEAALARVAQQERVPFIDPIREHWITASNEASYAGRVPGHPNNAGYAYIAGRVVADLHTLLHLPVSAPTHPA